MPRGEDTSRHPGRQIDNYRPTPRLVSLLQMHAEESSEQPFSARILSGGMADAKIQKDLNEYRSSRDTGNGESNTALDVAGTVRDAFRARGDYFPIDKREAEAEARYQDSIRGIGSIGHDERAPSSSNLMGYLGY